MAEKKQSAEAVTLIVMHVMRTAVNFSQKSFLEELLLFSD